MPIELTLNSRRWIRLFFVSYSEDLKYRNYSQMSFVLVDKTTHNVHVCMWKCLEKVKLTRYEWCAHCYCIVSHCIVLANVIINWTASSTLKYYIRQRRKVIRSSFPYVYAAFAFSIERSAHMHLTFRCNFKFHNLVQMLHMIFVVIIVVAKNPFIVLQCTYLVWTLNEWVFLVTFFMLFFLSSFFFFSFDWKSSGDSGCS